MNIVKKKVDELIPYVNNPRNNENAVDKVASSIKEFGFQNPIIINNNNVVLAGHTRLLASKKLGLISLFNLSHIASKGITVSHLQAVVP